MRKFLGNGQGARLLGAHPRVNEWASQALILGRARPYQCRLCRRGIPAAALPRQETEHEPAPKPGVLDISALCRRPAGADGSHQAFLERAALGPSKLALAAYEEARQGSCRKYPEGSAQLLRNAIAGTVSASTPSASSAAMVRTKS